MEILIDNQHSYLDVWRIVVPEDKEMKKKLYMNYIVSHMQRTQEFKEHWKRSESLLLEGNDRRHKIIRRGMYTLSDGKGDHPLGQSKLQSRHIPESKWTRLRLFLLPAFHCHTGTVI